MDILFFFFFFNSSVLQYLFKRSAMHSSSKMTDKALHFALTYMISVQSLLSALPGSSAWFQLMVIITVMTKDSHPQRQVRGASRKPAILPAQKKIHIYIYHKALLSLVIAVYYTVNCYFFYKWIFSVAVTTQISVNGIRCLTVFEQKVITYPFKLLHFK